MTLRLLLIRHGLSSFNRENRIQGRNDLSTLTDTGFKQACQAGEAIKQLQIHAVYSSPLQRAADTTKELLKASNNHLNPILDKNLLEVDLSSWSGCTVDEIKTKNPDAYLTWKNSPEELTIHRDDGSSYKPIKELMRQAQEFLTDIYKNHLTEKEQTILIIGHNAILRCLILNLLNKPKSGFRRIKLDNASISIFNINLNRNNQFEVQIESLNNTTHLNPKLPSKSKENARIFLVRHGETDWNKEGRFQGQIDIPLNQNGKDQALAAADFLKEVNFNKAFSSSMSRPFETAKIILNKHPTIKIQKQKELREIGHGLWEGKLQAEIISDWKDLLNAWQEAPETVQMPEGESIEEVSNRAIQCWEKLCSSLSTNDIALVVAHDAVNKTILCNLLGLSHGDIWKVKQGNGGITIIDISNEEGQPDVVTCLNITSHLGGVIDRTAEGAL